VPTIASFSAATENAAAADVPVLLQRIHASDCISVPFIYVTHQLLSKMINKFHSHHQWHCCPICSYTSPMVT
jgi:hypothetical protein